MALIVCKPYQIAFQDAVDWNATFCLHQTLSILTWQFILNTSALLKASTAVPANVHELCDEYVSLSEFLCK